MTHPQLVAAMSRPEFYPDRPDAVELVQTHISLIFLAGDTVYKVKKAVDFGFLDFTTLAKRRHYCNEELRLNRRLAPQAYLEVVAVTADPNGEPRLGGAGPVVEYAVKMRRLPQERMLKRLLAEGSMRPETMEAVAQKLAAFHREAETGGEIDRIGGIETIRRNHEENFEQTEPFIGRTIPAEQYRFIRAYALGFLERERALFDQRVADHRIRDCHGDLHLEHILVADDILIFDCIEFNERFRYEDVAAEVAFLAMDLDFNGYAVEAVHFVEAYIRCTGDTEIRTLLNFYKCYYAYVRGKVVGFRLDDTAIAAPDRDEAARTAGRYFDLAYTYAAHLERPALILIAGLMGTGKSLLARRLAPLLGATIIRMDVLRKEILALAPTDRRYENFGEGIYSEEISRKTYDTALQRADDLLAAGNSVIIDASYKRDDERRRAEALGRRHGAAFYILDCLCPEALIRRRLDTRAANAEEPSDGRWDIFEAQRADFDPMSGWASGVHIAVDTGTTPEAMTAEALRGIRQGR
ncbi:MAG TPA: AAA family ATPase [Syntrophales bacterium]|nr:AAA family ATPase [Syntrophales bacterium]